MTPYYLTLQRSTPDPKAPTFGTLTVPALDAYGVDTPFAAATYKTLELPRQTVDGRVNVPDQCAILAGHYPLVVLYSDHFRRALPHVLAVPGRDAIEMHPGNTIADVRGCVMSGMTADATGVWQSVSAQEVWQPEVEKALLAGRPVFIDVRDPAATA